KLGNVIGIVRKVAIHLEYKLVIALQSPNEAITIGSAQSILLSTVEHMDSWVPRSQFVRELTSPIRRVVIHNQQIHVHRQIQDALNQRREVLPLIVSRDYDQRFGSSRHRFSAQCSNRRANVSGILQPKPARSLMQAANGSQDEDGGSEEAPNPV